MDQVSEVFPQLAATTLSSHAITTTVENDIRLLTHEMFIVINATNKAQQPNKVGFTSEYMKYHIFELQRKI